MLEHLGGFSCCIFELCIFLKGFDYVFCLLHSCMPFLQKLKKQHTHTEITLLIILSDLMKKI